VRLKDVVLGLALGAFVRPHGDEDTPGPSPEDAVASAEVARVVRAAVRRLPWRERSLLYGHYFGGRTLDDAARKMGISKSWGSRLHKQALKALRRELRRAHVGARS
jgi:RNA polymerase sigma factor for flagellar operon FliA